LRVSKTNEDFGDLSSHPNGAHLEVEDGVRASGEDGADVVSVGGARVVDVDQVGRLPRAQEPEFDKSQRGRVIGL